jgi:DNA-binding CsgD family transcriptional regulator
MSAIEELASCAAVTTDQQRRKWTAVPPSKFLDGLRERRARIGAAARALARNLSIMDISGVVIDHAPGAAPISDFGSALDRLGEVMGAATIELLTMNPETAFTSASAQAGVPVGRSALTNGARTRSLGVPSAADDESDAYASELLSYGLEHREALRQPVKLWIADRRTAFFPIDPTRNFRAGIWEISSPGLVDELVTFFLGRWDAASAPSSSWQPPPTLSDRERAVLAALALGHTDETAARHLRLSSRTVRYVVRELMDRYQVKTRFQLGLVVGHQSEGADT